MKKRTICIETAIAGFAVAAVVGCKMLNEKENDDAKLHTEDSGEVIWRQDATFYEKFVKRALDIGISFCGLIVSAPVLAVASAVVFIEDPGKVVFRQKRVGIHKTYFYIHKLRSMRENKGDVPTHLLSGEDQKRLILKSGAFFRKTSIDELYQLIDTLRGRMSIVGPRPALWNQDDLVAERDKYGANDVRPGITGWAQINGRDELPIPVKAKLDGYYTERLKKSSLSGFAMDCRCFFGTVRSVLKHDGVVEGGTGSKSATAGGIGARDYTAGVSERELIGKIGFDNPVNVVHNKKRRVLITGAGSYIGEAFEHYAKERYADDFAIDTLDMTDEGWREADFAPYDIVYHVAGLAHADVGNVSAETREKYYRVNTDLAVETAQKAKASGVKEFVFMSSMIVYGESAPYGTRKVVGPLTAPKPANFYGDSKLQADVAVRALADGAFKVAVLRPPMIYGRGSKGNYPTLAKLAKKMPVFPQVENERSMLYIENLCEFLCQLFLVDEAMFADEGNVFFPQNGAYTCTSDMVAAIAGASGHKIRMAKPLAAAVRVAGMLPGKIGAMTNKAFGNSCYETEMSRYEGLDYQVVGVEESVRRTEGKDIAEEPDEKRALILASVASMIEQFNMENIQLLLDEGFRVDVACNCKEGSTISDEKIAEMVGQLREKGVEVTDVPIPRKITDANGICASFQQVKALCDANRYTIVHCHSPIGGVVARLAACGSRRRGCKVIYTAHGFHFYKGAPLKNWLLYYPVEWLLSWVTDVLITINREDHKRAKKHMHARKTVYVPGVGIDTKKFSPGNVDAAGKRAELGVAEDEIMLLSVGELSKRKNHEVVIRAVAKLCHPKVRYFICGIGPLEKELGKLIHELHVETQVTLLGYRTDIAELCGACDLFVFPSKQEGLPVALMEAMAAGVPCVVSRIRGNTDLITQNEGGALVDPDDVEEFASAIGGCLADEERMLRSGKRNIRKIAAFDWKVVGQRMRKVYFA